MEIKRKIEEEVDLFLQEWDESTKKILSCHGWNGEKWKNDKILDSYIPCVKKKDEIINIAKITKRMRNENNIREKAIDILKKIGEIDNLSEEMNNQIMKFLKS